MKLSFTWIAVTAMVILSCKKDKAIAINEGTIREEYPVCADDGWVEGYKFGSFFKNLYFEYNNKVYLPQEIGGSHPGDQQVHVFDGSTWTSKPSSIPEFTSFHNISFTIGNKGYMGYYQFPSGVTKFYEYNITTNNWTRKTDFPGIQEAGAAFFVINGKGYVAGGRKHNGDFTSETWEYNPATNTWTQRKNLILVRAWATGFSVGNKGYILHGKLPNELGYYTNLTEYDPATNKWTNKASYPGPGRSQTKAFVIDGVVYAGGGSATSEYFTDFHKYNVASNNWTKVDDIPYRINYGNTFVIDSKGYVAYHVPDGDGPALTDSMIKYYPARCVEVGGNISGISD
jgi:N-acetylneuraminic acid mutarotase